MKSYRGKFSIRLYVTFAIIAVFASFSAVMWAVATFLGSDSALYVESPNPIYILTIIVIVSIVIILLFSRLVMVPLMRLNKAMEDVANGDFTVRLDERSIVKEIEDAYRNFNAMVEQLAATEMLQSDFVSNVSHEIRTPVAAIEGYAMLLQDDNQSDEQKAYVNKILFNTRRLSELVGNILLLSKLDNQTSGMKMETFRLDEQIRYAIVSLEPKWEKKEIDFDVDMETLEYRGSEPLLQHVWLNLIDNAIKFDPYGGVVRIKLRREDAQAVFTVRDNGPGVSEVQTERIFTKFYQSDSSHKDEGSGLGLALVKKIVAMHGGTVEVANHINGGCVFTVKLPVERE